jgi:hypothetical protein
MNANWSIIVNQLTSNIRALINTPFGIANFLKHAGQNNSLSPVVVVTRTRILSFRKPVHDLQTACVAIQKISFENYQKNNRN